jgi:1,4-alpha-glucan branching enzyme
MTKASKKPAAVSGGQRRSLSKKVVLFEYFDPAAQIVTVAGEFNGWDALAKPLKRDAAGLWRGTVRLEAGTYQYKFVVNGERWEEDPLNPHHVPNAYGSFNSIREVS